MLSLHHLILIQVPVWILKSVVPICAFLCVCLFSDFQWLSVTLIVYCISCAGWLFVLKSRFPFFNVFFFISFCYSILVTHGKGSRSFQSAVSKPFITRKGAIQYLQRKRRAYKHYHHIIDECNEHDCVYEEVREYCVGGCYEDGKHFCGTGCEVCSLNIIELHLL